MPQAAPIDAHGDAIGEAYRGHATRSARVKALLILGSLSAFGPFAPSVGALTVGRLIQGCARAAGIVLARAVVRDLYSGTAMVRFFSTLMLATAWRRCSLRSSAANC